MIPRVYDEIVPICVETYSPRKTQPRKYGLASITTVAVYACSCHRCDDTGAGCDHLNLVVVSSNVQVSIFHYCKAIKIPDFSASRKDSIIFTALAGGLVSSHCGNDSNRRIYLKLLIVILIVIRINSAGA